MKSMEERLWDYIDGTCTNDEKLAIEALMAQNHEWAKKHEELKAFNNDISAVEPDEPPMGFAFKVMEQIRSDEARTPLKTAVNTYVIKGIAAVFVVMITAILILAFANISLTFGNAAVDINIQGINIFADNAFLKIFSYLDIMLVLFFADTFLRKKLRRIDA